MKSSYNLSGSSIFYTERITPLFIEGATPFTIQHILPAHPASQSVSSTRNFVDDIQSALISVSHFSSPFFRRVLMPETLPIF
jgi:hypothetical protein